MSNQLAPLASPLPALPAEEIMPTMAAVRGEQAAWRYLEFFAVSIRNPNTRAAYVRAASAFFTKPATRRRPLPNRLTPERRPTDQQP